MVTKPYGAQTQPLLHKNDELGQNCVFGQKLFEQTLLNTCATCVYFFLNGTQAIINSKNNIFFILLKIVYIHFIVLWLISRTSIQFHIVLYVKNIILFFCFWRFNIILFPKFLVVYKYFTLGVFS